MRSLLTCFAGLALALAVFASEESPAMPNEITLTTGRVLRNVTVLRWEKDRVVVKHAAGADPIAFSLIAEPLRSQIAAIRASDARARAAAAAELAKAARTMRTVTGQVFVVTKGRSNYLMGDLTIYFVPVDEMDRFTAGISRSEFESRRTSYVPMGPRVAALQHPEEVWLFEKFEAAPRGTFRVRTDGEGRFTIKLPPQGEYYAFARDSRMVYTMTEWYVWLKRLGQETATLTLSNSDLWEPKE